MDYNGFIQIKMLLSEREQLKKSVSLIQEMTVKGTSLPEFQTRLVFAELKEEENKNVEYHPILSWHKMMMQISGEVSGERKPEWKETGMILLDDILLLHVASVLADHWDKRIREINTQIKSLGMEP